MDLSNFLGHNCVAVLGAGKFGTAVANLLAPNVARIWLYMRGAEKAFTADKNRYNAGQVLADNIIVTNNISHVVEHCSVLFPVVPAAYFRTLMRSIAPLLTTEHLLIHATKGLDIAELSIGERLCRSHLSTMSEVIQQETKVRYIGCMAGPNLSGELAKKQPTATVVASGTEIVLTIGKQLLTNNWFHVYTNKDLLSVELSGVLKNIFAIGAGLLHGIGYGHNSYGLFLTLAMTEMAYIMGEMGGSGDVLLSPSGIGDLVATCGSSSSRNYKIGYRFAKGEKLSTILADTKEVAEGVQTIQTIYNLPQLQKASIPITSMLYRLIFEDIPLSKAIASLMRGQCV